MAEQGLGILHQIWESTTKLSIEAIEAAKQKAVEANFDLDKGIVSFAETQINLIHSRDVIADAIEHEKLVQLPLSIQKDLLALLNAIIGHLVAIAGGGDEITLYVNKVDQLNVFLWQFGFHNLSSEVLGYQEKMNRLKTMELEAGKLLTELHASEKLKKTAAALVSDAQKSKDALQSTADEAETQKKLIDIAAAAVTTTQQAASASLASIKQQNEDSARLIASITSIDGQAKTNGDQIANLLAQTSTKVEELNSTISSGQQANKSSQAAVEALISQLTSQIGTLQKDQKNAFETLESDLKASATALTTTSTKAISDFESASKQELSATLKRFTTILEKTGSEWNLAANSDLQGINTRAKELLDTETEKLHTLTSELKALELQIKDQIEKAIGYSLFGAFQKRQESIVKSKQFWQIGLFICVAAGIGLGGYFVYALRGMTAFTYAYLAKLSLSLPVIYAISFCNIQYGKERRLEEEYAFKASISVSLNPYQELVGRIVDLKVAEERAKYTDFIIHSIGSVFDSPTDKVYESEVKPAESASLEKLTKQLTPILEPLAKIFGHK